MRSIGLVPTTVIVTAVSQYRIDARMRAVLPAKGHANHYESTDLGYPGGPLREAPLEVVGD